MIERRRRDVRRQVRVEVVHAGRQWHKRVLLEVLVVGSQRQAHPGGERSAHLCFVDHRHGFLYMAVNHTSEKKESNTFN